ncbi:hypothetical protein [Caldimonas sp. KR1-144]|uniref:hypothetical protein n=1 Tax=Caldimonas sp. KR1-144 TaxID=3400911 RepID=UPI003C101A06
MSELHSLTATFWNESAGHCECCGRTSRTIWGDLSDSNGTHAVYFVQWTVGAPEHPPNIDLVLGRWGEGAEPSDRVLVSLLFQPGREGGSFMVTSGHGRPADDRSVCGRALRREEVVGTPLAADIFALVDALWLSEPRIEEVRKLNNVA